MQVQDLGRHVRHLALHLAFARAARAPGGLRDAEVEEARDAVRSDDDVLGRDVAVDDAERVPGRIRGVVRGVEAEEHAVRDAHRDVARALLAGLRARLEEACERLAVHVLHDEQELVIDRDDVDDRHHVRVPDALAEARLLEEQRDELGIARELLVQALDGDRLREASRADGATEVDRGHTAGRELAVELVTAHHPRLRSDGHPPQDSTASSAQNVSAKEPGAPAETAGCVVVVGWRR